jgi:CRP-like cAMP-binding protein
MLLLGRKSADEKIASFLLALAERARDEHRPAYVVHVPMSRQDMADYLGLTIETVSRTLSRFRRDGLIGLPGRQQVVLRQLALLEALADGEEAETRPFQPRLEAEPLQA